MFKGPKNLFELSKSSRNWVFEFSRVNCINFNPRPILVFFAKQKQSMVIYITYICIFLFLFISLPYYSSPSNSSPSSFTNSSNYHRHLYIFRVSVEASSYCHLLITFWIICFLQRWVEFLSNTSFRHLSSGIYLKVYSINKYSYLLYVSFFMLRKF